MDNHHLRSILLKLQDRLSDNDRERLHFFLGDDVPRRIRDNSTLSGTLKLMESLFDQDKINEKDFTFLIDAFNEIQCIDAVKLLREHRQRMQASWSKQSSIPPLNEQIVQDQEEEEDKSASHNSLTKIINYGHYTKIIHTNETDIKPVTIIMDNNQPISSSSKEKQPCYISLRINKCLLFLVLFLIVLVAIFIIIFIMRIGQTDTSALQINYDRLLKEQKQKKNNSLIIAGDEFGGTGGSYFDDSLHPHFTCAYHLSGLYARDNNDGLESYQFLYSSSSSSANDDQGPLESLTHGNQTSAFKRKFLFPTNEKINRIEGRIVHKSSLSPNGTNLTMSIVTGLRFFSTRGRASPSYEGELGEIFEEEFDGYILGYVTGRSGQYIEQLQFFWYRTAEINE